MPSIHRSTSRAAAFLLLALFMGACSDNSSRGSTDSGTPTEPLVDSGDAQTSDVGGVCDTDCIADRLLAIYQSLEPGCRCAASDESPLLYSDRIEDCARRTDERLSEWVSPRECMARYFSDLEIAAELESWIACREERIRTRGPCIMALEAGDSCDQCPEFWDGGGDPCTFLDTDNNHFEICLDQMSGRPWE
jgi:hypothetical protein